MVKINVDGAIVKNHSKGGAAALCRDNQGFYLGSSARIINMCDNPDTPEATACVEALSLVARVNSKKLPHYGPSFRKTTTFFNFPKNYHKSGWLFQKTQVAERLSFN